MEMEREKTMLLDRDPIKITHIEMHLKITHIPLFQNG
jgi:hypothetical protein